MGIQNIKKPTLVDLFSGCGGFALGGELAGFHSAIAVDIALKIAEEFEE